MPAPRAIARLALLACTLPCQAQQLVDDSDSGGIGPEARMQSPVQLTQDAAPANPPPGPQLRMDTDPGIPDEPPGSPEPPPEPAAPAAAPPPEERVRFSHQGQLTLRLEADPAQPSGPLAAANMLQPGIVPVARREYQLAAEGTGDLHADHADLVGRWWLERDWSRQAYSLASPGNSRLTFKELYGRYDGTPWSVDLGRKVVSWDVGQGFRPNDLVQFEDRRALLPFSLEGVPLLQAERFGADSALSFVFANPTQLGSSLADAPGREEAMVATRYYLRAGDADLYGFGRWGRHTGTSLGAALAWVTSDETELHASVRALQHRTSWQFADVDPGALATTTPWTQGLGRGTGQALIGGSWTGANKQSVLVEWWYDGSALSDRQWRLWRQRNEALAALVGQAPDAAVAGNLAWQALPLNGLDGDANLRRDNLLLRWAWQHEAWNPSLDVVVTPADGAAVWTLGNKWQGDQWSWTLAWRHFGGPSASVFNAVPMRDMAVFWLQLAY